MKTGIWISMVLLGCVCNGYAESKSPFRDAAAFWQMGRASSLQPHGDVQTGVKQDHPAVFSAPPSYYNES